jgi:hypothetical protein
MRSNRWTRLLAAIVLGAAAAASATALALDVGDKAPISHCRVDGQGHQVRRLRR